MHNKITSNDAGIMSNIPIMGASQNHTRRRRGVLTLGFISPYNRMGGVTGGGAPCPQKKNLTLNLLTLTLTLTLMIFAGCSIFDLKTGEPPLAGSGREDPLNISDILRIADPAVTDKSYVEYFTENAVFEDYQQIRMYGGDHIAAMLERLRARAAFVDWDVGNAGSNRYEGSLRIIEGVPYIVSADGTTYHGVADFRIERGVEYRISSWKDMPNGQPFFEIF